MTSARLAASALLLAAACKPPLPILTWHSVSPHGDDFAVTPDAFARQLDLLVARGLKTITLHDLAERRFGPKDVVLTFDDGFADARTTVLPLLAARGLRGTFFIVPAFVGTPGYLDWDGVRALRKAGMEIGSHTVDHARLGSLPDEKVAWELRESKRLIELQLGEPIEAIAYPYNSLRGHMIGLAESAGYRVGVSGHVHGGGDPLDLQRYTVKSKTTLDELGKALPGR